ncbi:MAG: sulfite exporter TauE/SafE family protein [Candidatus Bathyarchaeota archaeon]|nr:sulfite exporter TauE/SafE family protein [Candidatus Bathyarchaeota archaeon]MDH5754595.1 sulfite exporter TauE/SafE family protein [Candidatus Bathyarchaeota archaeon]
MFEELMGLFFLGIVTFLSPCSIALISVYLTYAVGVSKSVRKGFIIGCSFTIAMCLVFFFLGYAVSSLIPVDPASYRFFFGISGVLLILFGINNLGLFKKVSLSANASSSFTERINALKLTALTRFSKYNYAIGSFLFGIVISLALGPCSLSLVLPAILLTIFSAPTPYHGGLLLFTFGLGHALPVIFLSVLLATARKAVIEKTAIAGEWLTKIFGTAFVVIGVVMIGYVLGGW